MSESGFDLNQLVPPVETIKHGGTSLYIAPVFTGADAKAFERIERRLDTETAYELTLRRARFAHEQATRAATASGDELPAFVEPARPADTQPYTMSDFEGDLHRSPAVTLRLPPTSNDFCSMISLTRAARTPTSDALTWAPFL